MVEKYSKFNTKQIGECLAKLLNEKDLDKNCNYFYKEGYYYEEGDYYEEDYGYELVKKYVSYLIPKLFEKEILNNLHLGHETDEINFEKLSSLAKGKDAIILSNSYDKIDSITYYEYDYDEKEIYCKTSLNQHRFALDFIDYVIQYKIENQIENISFEELDMLRMEYISKNKNKVLIKSKDKN